MFNQEQIQQVARARLEPGTTRLQVWHPNHSAMLPPEHTLVCTLVHCLIPQNTKQRPKLAFLSSFTRSQPLGHFCIGKRSFWMVKIQETFWATYFKVNNYYYCWLNLSIALSFVHLLLINGTPFMYLRSWTNVLEHFNISGAFSNSHRPNPSPHPTNNVWRVYPEFFRVSICIGWGREKCGKFWKRCIVLWENPERQKNMHIALLSQGLLFMIVV